MAEKPKFVKKNSRKGLSLGARSSSGRSISASPSPRAPSSSTLRGSGSRGGGASASATESGTAFPMPSQAEEPVKKRRKSQYGDDITIEKEASPGASMWEAMLASPDTTVEDLAPMLKLYGKRVKELDSEMGSLKSDLVERDERIATLESEKEELETQMAEAEEKRSEETMSEVQQAVIKKMVNDEEVMKARIEELEDLNRSLSIDVERLTTQLSAANQTIDRMQVEMKKSSGSDAGADDDDSDRQEAGAADSTVEMSVSEFDAFFDKEKSYKRTIDALTAANEALEKDLALATVRVESVEIERRQSVATLHSSMFSKLMDAEAESEEQISDLKDKVKKLEQENARLSMRVDDSESKRRMSISTLQDNMLNHLYEAEEEFKDEKERMQVRIKELEAELRIAQLESGVMMDEKKAAKARAVAAYEGELGDDEDSEDLKATIKELTDDREQLRSQIQKYEKKVEMKEMERRDSVASLHDAMFRRLMESENQYARKLEEKDGKIELLEAQLHAYKSGTAMPTKGALARDSDDEREQDSSDGEGEPGAPAKEDDDEPTWHSRESVGGMQSKIKTMKRELDRRDKQLKELSTRVEDTERSRRKSVSYLEDRMMQQLLETKEDYDKDKEAWEESERAVKAELADVQAQLKAQKELNMTLESTRRSSVSTISSNMFTKILAVEREKTELKEDYEAQLADLEDRITELTEEIADLQQQLETKDSEARKSFSALHTSHFKALLDAEADATEEREEWDTKVKHLEGKLKTEEKKRRQSVTQMQSEVARAAVISHEKSELEGEMLQLGLRVTELEEEVKDLTQRVVDAEMSKCEAIADLCGHLDTMRSAVRVYSTMQ